MTDYDSRKQAEAEEREEIKRRLAEELAEERVRAVVAAQQKTEEAARRGQTVEERVEELRRYQEARRLINEQQLSQLAEERRIRPEQAGDKEKLTAYLRAVMAVETPLVKSGSAANILSAIRNYHHDKMAQIGAL